LSLLASIKAASTVPPVQVWQGTRPLLLDSPHSGTHYPADFAVAIAQAQLREAEDTHVDALFAPWIEQGATLIAAQFPRSYIDPNRAVSDIDPALLQAPWQGRTAPSAKSALGKGLIWRCLDDGTPLYTDKLTQAQCQQRIDAYWQPYWQALRQQAQRLHTQHGMLYHINCHSMPSRAAAFSTATAQANKEHPDFVVGDRDGTTCDHHFARHVMEYLRAQGYQVSYNDPYKGVEIVRVLGQPQRAQHSLQLEVNRKLYMHEDTRQLHDGFEKMRAVLSGLGQALIQRFGLDR
jgi:N-formylglutamate deformylase